MGDRCPTRVSWIADPMALILGINWTITLEYLTQAVCGIQDGTISHPWAYVLVIQFPLELLEMRHTRYPTMI